jgi:hypothetical protein
VAALVPGVIRLICFAIRRDGMRSAVLLLLVSVWLNGWKSDFRWRSLLSPETRLWWREALCQRRNRLWQPIFLLL